MTTMQFTQLHRSDHDRVVAGVCAGSAETIDVDPTVVRLVFTLLALAGGAGIVLYAAVWLYTNGKMTAALIVTFLAACGVLTAFGLSTHAAIAFVLIGGVFNVPLNELKKLPNVRILAQKPYELMPSYLLHFDVCIIPFVVTIDDEGHGIPDENLESIFQRFYSERPTEHFGQHSGLGLSICRQIMETYGGSISAANRRAATNEPGGGRLLGARFTIRVPAAAGK